MRTLNTLSEDPVKTIAVFFFFFGGFLTLFCGFRLFIRAYKLMYARGRAAKTDLIERIRLKDTFVLEVLGLMIGVVTSLIAQQFL